MGPSLDRSDCLFLAAAVLAEPQIVDVDTHAKRKRLEVLPLDVLAQLEW